ncbi:S41 family peptidase [Bacteroides uniformis]|nr:S41 family peptidase [Bacteroides uniformis]
MYIHRGSKKIGYLVYNHFSSGPTDNSNEYDNDLRSAFQYFASQQVNEFILDLRYNNGGLLSCAELLCTMLAPSSALGQELGYLEFNNRFNPQIVPFTLELRTHRKRSKPKPRILSTYLPAARLPPPPKW